MTNQNATIDLSFEHSDIVERIYPRLDEDVEAFILDHSGKGQPVDEVVDFCIDSKGRVRKNVGMIAIPGLGDEDNMNCVPHERYEIETSPWNSHDLYFELTLPNPSTDPAYFYMIRATMIAELKKRLEKQVKKALKKKAK